MASLGTLQLGTYTNVSSTAIQGSDPVLEAIGSTDDTDYVYDATNSTHTGTARFALGDTPADFGSIATVSINLRYARASGTQVNTWDSLQARIFKSDGTTALTALTTIASTITTTTLTNSGAIAMGSPDTAATKADWDGAVVHLYWNITKVKSGDTLRKNVYATEVTGTYDLAPVNASIAATQATDAAAITAANWTTAQVAATQATDVAALTTTVTTGATVAATQATDTAAITAANWMTAQVAATQATDSAAITGAIWTTAQIAAVQETDVVAVTVEVVGAVAKSRDAGSSKNKKRKKYVIDTSEYVVEIKEVESPKAPRPKKSYKREPIPEQAWADIPAFLADTSSPSRNVVPSKPDRELFDQHEEEALLLFTS